MSPRGSLEFLTPDWPAPPRVRAAFSLRRGGVSAGPWTSLNLGGHVADDPAAVIENRRRLRAALGLPGEPYWLSQVHGIDVARPDLDALAVEPLAAPRPRIADAVATRKAGRVLVIQVADCLPVLFTARDGSVVAGAHAGWRGLAGGVLEATVAAMATAPADLMAWIGPGIGPGHFEVGGEVRDAFVRGVPGGAGQLGAAGGCGMAGDPGAADAFVPNVRGRWLCDLRQLAVRRLAGAGVTAVYGADRGHEWCTHADSDRFFSHRRDGQCGRMAALVWME